MSKLQIITISDPVEFVNTTYENRDNILYLFMEKIFEPIIDISIFAQIYEEYNPSAIFSDIVINYHGIDLIQYYNDIENTSSIPVLSPICVQRLNTKLTTNDGQYQSINFMQQLRKFVFPWHIATPCFKIQGEDFNKIWATQ